MLNISNFNDVSDYISILNGVLITDLIVIFLLLNKFIRSTVLHLFTFQTPIYIKLK